MAQDMKEMGMDGAMQKQQKRGYPRRIGKKKRMFPGTKKRMLAMPSKQRML